jgi:hypothetical protein
MQICKGIELITPAKLEKTKAEVGCTSVKPKREQAMIHRIGAAAT